MDSEKWNSFFSGLAAVFPRSACLMLAGLTVCASTTARVSINGVEVTPSAAIPPFMVMIVGCLGAFLALLGAYLLAFHIFMTAMKQFGKAVSLSQGLWVVTLAFLTLLCGSVAAVSYARDLAATQNPVKEWGFNMLTREVHMQVERRDLEVSPSEKLVFAVAKGDQDGPDATQRLVAVNEYVKWSEGTTQFKVKGEVSEPPVVGQRLYLYLLEAPEPFTSKGMVTLNELKSAGAKLVTDRWLTVGVKDPTAEAFITAIDKLPVKVRTEIRSRLASEGSVKLDSTVSMQ